MDSPLAFDAEGEPLDLPDEAVGWKVRRRRVPRPGTSKPGPSEVVYADTGAPLVLDLDADGEALLDAAGPGRYTLEAVDERGRKVAGDDGRPVVAVAQVGDVSAAESLPGELPRAVEETLRALRESMATLAAANAQLVAAVAGSLNPGLALQAARERSRATVQTVAKPAEEEEEADSSLDKLMGLLLPLVEEGAPLARQYVLAKFMNGAAGGGGAS